MTFDLETFDRQMAELDELGRRQMEILGDMLRELGVDPEEVEAEARVPIQRAERRSARITQQEDGMTTMNRAVSDKARAAMMRCTVDDDAISPPSIHTEKLEQAVYGELKAILESLGGTWKRARQAFEFTELRGRKLAERFYEIAETGTWERAQDYGFFPTPDDLVARMIQMAGIEPHHRVLEPSAGQGAIAARVAEKLASVNQISTFELLPENQRILHALGLVVDGYDFLQFEAGPLFDRVLMNPPFNKGMAPVHVMHAMKLLKTGGKLVAIMPSSIVQRQDRLYRTCRWELLMNGKIMPLPDDTFKASGTSVRTVIVEWTKPVGWAPAEIPSGMAPVAPQRDEKAPVALEAPKEPRKPFKRLSSRFKRVRRMTRSQG